MHRNICCHTEEIVFTGTNLCVYKASQPYYIIVYKASPLEGKQEKGKAKKKKKKWQNISVQLLVQEQQQVGRKVIPSL